MLLAISYLGASTRKRLAIFLPLYELRFLNTRHLNPPEYRGFSMAYLQLEK